MRGIDLERAGERYVHGMMQAYLEGKKNLDWIKSVIGKPTPTVREMFEQLKGYGDPARYKELSDWLQGQ